MKEIELEIRKICTIYDKDYFKSRGEENAEYSLTEEQFEKIFDLIKHLSDVHKEKHALQGKTLDEILENYANHICSTLQKELGIDTERRFLASKKLKTKQEILDWVDKEIIGEKEQGEEDVMIDSTIWAIYAKESREQLREQQRQKLQNLKEI